MTESQLMAVSCLEVFVVDGCHRMRLPVETTTRVLTPYIGISYYTLPLQHIAFSVSDSVLLLIWASSGEVYNCCDVWSKASGFLRRVRTSAVSRDRIFVDILIALVSVSYQIWVRAQLHEHRRQMLRTLLIVNVHTVSIFYYLVTSYQCLTLHLAFFCLLWLNLRYW